MTRFHMVAPSYLERIASRSWHDEHFDPYVNGPTWLRLWALALNRSTRDGHAEFAPGELAELLGVTRGALHKAIKRAGEVGLIAVAASGERCIHMPPGIEPDSEFYGCDWCHDGANPRRHARRKGRRK